jgi:hypothetical protein
VNVGAGATEIVGAAWVETTSAVLAPAEGTEQTAATSTAPAAAARAGAYREHPNMFYRRPR